MKTSNQNQWNGSNAKDTFFNAALVGMAVFVVVAQVAVAGGGVFGVFGVA